MKRFLALFIAAIMLMSIAPLAFADDIAIQRIDIVNADVEAIIGVYPENNLGYELDEATFNDEFYEGDHYWYCDYDETDEFDWFEPDKGYSMCWVFYADTGYVFTDDVVTTINGSDTLIDYAVSGPSEDGSEFYLWTKPADSVEGSSDAITYIYLSDVVTNPAAGYTPSDFMTITETSAKYDITAYEWYCDSDDEFMENDAKFVMGKAYSSLITIEPKDDYFFDDPLVYINGTDDDVDSAYEEDGAFYVWTVMNYLKDEPVIPDSAFFFENFEAFDDTAWTILDEDGDGFTWELTDNMLAYDGDFCIISASWDSEEGALNPDNWLISPSFTCEENGVLSWADLGMDNTYCEENYSVYVLPADYTDLSQAEEIWTGVSTGVYRTVFASLADYAGQDIRIAFRHHDITDMFRLSIDFIIALRGVDADGVTLNETAVTVEEWSSVQLTATVTPDDATNKNVTWSSSDASVATVNANGLVSGIKAGTATITVTTDDGGFTASCEVTVVKGNVLFFENFENFNESNWQFRDLDGDGCTWEVITQDGGMYQIYEGEHCIVSQSYLNGIGALTPDNWMISSPFKASSDAVLSWVDIGQDPSYCDENYSVYILPSDYINLLDEAVEVYGGMPTGEYQTHTVDLGAYEGQSIRIAFRHYDVTDMYWLNIDLIKVTGTPVVVNEYTVTFVDGLTQEIIGTVTVKEGEDAPFPSDVEHHEGYVFVGWDKDGKNITEDTTITALYEETDICIVDFVDGLTGEFIKEITVKRGEDVAEEDFPEAPSHEDIYYTFIGWDSDGKNITGDTDITALYTNDYTVTLVDGLTNEVIETIPVEGGSDVEFPEAPVHNGYTFVGWDNDGKCITADITITALYEEIAAEIILGDANGDTVVDTRDAVVILKLAAGMTTLTEEQAKAADVNHDGIADTRDVVIILKFMAGMISELPKE